VYFLGCAPVYHQLYFDSGPLRGDGMGNTPMDVVGVFTDRHYPGTESAESGAGRFQCPSP